MEDGKILIHVRFAPNGAVTEIGERPEVLAPQDWFNLLSDKAGMNYRTLAGGRGVFTLTRERIDEVKGLAAAS